VFLSQPAYTDARDLARLYEQCCNSSVLCRYVPFYGSKAQVLLSPSKSISILLLTVSSFFRHSFPYYFQVCLIPFYGSKAEVLLPPTTLAPSVSPSP
jgi:Mg-chelatase subunit ChlD